MILPCLLLGLRGVCSVITLQHRLCLAMLDAGLGEREGFPTTKGQAALPAINGIEEPPEFFAGGEDPDGKAVLQKEKTPPIGRGWLNVPDTLKPRQTGRGVAATGHDQASMP